MKHLEKIALAKTLMSPLVAAGAGGALGAIKTPRDIDREMLENPRLVNALMGAGLFGGAFGGMKGGRSLLNKNMRRFNKK